MKRRKTQTIGVDEGYAGPIAPSAGYAWLATRLRRAYGTPLGEFLSHLNAEDQEVVLRALYAKRYVPAEFDSPAEFEPTGVPGGRPSHLDVRDALVFSDRRDSQPH